VIEQAFVPVAGRVHVPPPENVPGWELVNVTVPLGRMLAPRSVSETVAVQLEGEFTGTVDGEQLTTVPEVRLFTRMLVVPKLVA
jgi:hypothetical protein